MNRNRKKKLKIYLKIKFFLTILIILFFICNTNIQSAKASDYDIKVKRGDTFIYKVTDDDHNALNSLNIILNFDPDKGEKCCYKIYDIDTEGEYSCKIRYRFWQWTDEESDFFEGYDVRNKLKVLINPRNYGYGIFAVESIHNNSDIMMNIVLDEVDDYLKYIQWNPAKISVNKLTVIRDEGTYQVHYRYDIKGFLREYKILKDSSIVFRAIYVSERKNPTKNELFFDLLPFMIVTSSIVGITIITSFFVKKISGKKKYTIDKIIEKEEK